MQDRRAEHDQRRRRASRRRGRFPFCSTFAKFVERAYDQIEMAIISGANFKITGIHAGVTLAADGPSQMSLPDVAFFRSFCHVKNYNGRARRQLLLPRRRGELLQDHRADGQPRRLLLSADAAAETKILYKPDDTFEVGGFKVLREGKDVCLRRPPATWSTSASKAADELAKSGKKATVIDAYSLPLKVGRRAG